MNLFLLLQKSGRQENLFAAEIAELSQCPWFQRLFQLSPHRLLLNNDLLDLRQCPLQLQIIAQGEYSQI